MTEGSKRLLVIILLAIATAVLSLSAEARAENVCGFKYNFYFDLFQHFSWYVGLSICACWLFRQKPVWLVAVTVSVIAVFLEIIQYFIPQRSFSIHDILSSVSGVIVGALLVMLVRHLFPRRSQRGYGVR